MTFFKDDFEDKRFEGFNPFLKFFSHQKERLTSRRRM
jgi:hypothetical protein